MKLHERWGQGWVLALAIVLASGPAASEGDPAPWVERVEEAERTLRSGGASAAAERFAALLVERPLDLRAAEGRVHALLAANDWRSALAEAERLARERTAEIRLLSLLGEAAFRAGRLEQARAALEGLQERPDAPPRGLVTLGRLRDAEGRSDQAAELVVRAVAAAPTDPEVLYWAAQAAPSRGQAIEWLERFLEQGAGADEDRREAAQGTMRVFRSLGAKAVWTGENRPERLELPLTRLWDPATGSTQGFVVRVTLAERTKAVPLLLDSGSPGLFVLERVARKRGFVTVGEQTSFGGGGDGRHQTRRGFFEVFDLGGLRFRNALATTSADEIDPTGRYHGLLGLSVFDGYRVTLDLGHNRLLLERGSEGGGSPYWTVGGQWLVSATVGEGESGLFLFDTGATRTLVALGLVERLDRARLGPPVSIQAFGGQLGGARSLSGVEVAFEGLLTPPRDLRAADLGLRSRLGGIEISGFLGLDFLGDALLHVDTLARRIRIESPSRE